MNITEIRQFLHTFSWLFISFFVFLYILALALNLYLCKFSHSYIKIVPESTTDDSGLVLLGGILLIIFVFSIVLKKYFIGNYKKMWCCSFMLFVMCFIISILLNISQEVSRFSQCVVLFK